MRGSAGGEKRDDVGWRRRRDEWTVGVGWWEKEGSIRRGCAVVSASRRTAGDECASIETVGFGLCVRDWGLRLAEHALAASRRCELTKSWVRLLSATVPMSGGFGLLYETVSVLVDPY